MKLIHLSDIHIHNELIVGSDSVSRFESCMEHIGTHHSDADMVIISGDLTHYGDEDAYRTLKSLLSDWQHTPHLILGNHDNRKNFCSTFPDTPTDENGFIQYTIDTEEGRFVFVDTLEQGTHEGHLCESRLAWLDAQLTTAKREERPAFLVMHHQPTPIGVPNTDTIGLIDYDSFYSILRRHHHPKIRHIFFGHAHFILSGDALGIPISAPRSTSHPSVQHFGDPHIVGYGGIEPTYNVCLIHPNSVIIHSMEFLVDDRINWLTDEADR